MDYVNCNHYIHDARVLADYPCWADSAARTALAVYDRILWVQHPVSSIWWPWISSAAETDLLNKLGQGLETLSAQELQKAREMGLVLDQSAVLDATRKFHSEILKCRTEVAERGYTVLPQLTFDTYYNTVNYYTGTTMLGRDDQVKLRGALHSPALFTVVHKQIAEYVQRVVDEAIKPSYCYLGHYYTGAELVKHTDRDQCRWNASIAFARSAGDPVWPIWLEVDGVAHEVAAGLGEVIVYRGSELPHWREVLESGTATVCFFHFVNQSFTGDLR